MCDGWVVERWDTPISDIRSIALVSLVDDCDELNIIVEAPREPERPRWSFRFVNFPAYRNAAEGIRLRLWKHLDRSNQRCGHTFRVVASSWADDVAASEPLLRVYYPDIQHFVMTTEDDVIEILSDRPAEVLSLGPAPPDARAAGKSEVFYVPEDGSGADILKGPH